MNPSSANVSLTFPLGWIPGLAIALQPPCIDCNAEQSMSARKFPTIEKQLNEFRAPNHGNVVPMVVGDGATVNQSFAGSARRGPRSYIPFHRNNDLVYRPDIILRLNELLSAKDRSREAALWGLGGSGKTQIALDYAYRRSLSCSVFWVHAENDTTFIADYQQIARTLDIDTKGLDESEMLEQVHLAIQNESQWLLVIDNADDLELFGVDRRRLESVTNALGAPDLEEVATKDQQQKPKSSRSTTTSSPRDGRKPLTAEGRLPATAGVSQHRSGETKVPNSLMPYIPTGSRGTILWTTRDKKIVHNLVGASQGVEVTHMTEDEAKDLLANSGHDKLGSENEAAQINELLQELQWLPLAIYQAGAFMREAGIGVEEYLAKLRRGQDRWQTLTDTRHDRHRRPEVSNSVLETFHITIELLRNRNDQTYRTAYMILGTIAYLDNQTIPWEIMKVAAAYRGNSTQDQPFQDDGEVRTALKRLKDLSFLSERKTDMGERSYEMHKLVQEGVRYRFKKLAMMEVAPTRPRLRDGELPDSKIGSSSTKEPARKKLRSASSKKPQLPESRLATARTTAARQEPAGNGMDKGDGENYFARAALQVMDDLFPRQIEVETWKQCEKYLAHAIRLGEYADICSEPVRLAKLLMWVSSFLFERARWRERESVDLLAEALLRKELGDRDPLTLRSMSNLAQTYRMQDRYSEAAELHHHVLDLQQTVLGEKHRDTIASVQALAATLFDQGRFGESERMCVQVFEHRKEIQGERHPDTMLSMHNVARGHITPKCYHEAEELLLQVIHWQKDMQREKHPDALTHMHELATIYLKQHRYSEAENLLVQALQARKEVLGDVHPRVLITALNLAYVYRKQSRYSEAENILSQALQDSKGVLGEGDPRTLATMHNLAGLPGPARRRDIVDVDADVDAEIVAHGRGRHHRGSIDALSLGGLIDYVLHLVGLYSDYDFQHNDELLEFLVVNGDITKSEADQIGGIDILGLFQSNHGQGRLLNITDDIFNERKKELDRLESDNSDLGSKLLEDDEGEKMNGGVDVDVDSDIDISV
ncbi:Kinesin light chain [Paramyrothecium foliicola]|nr:Kinesin light chain [Paramyrothecium foliicola]